MTKKIIGRILLAIMITAVSMASVLEMSHDILHSINNPFHNHAVAHKKPIGVHTVKDHHFKKMKFAHEMDEPAGPPNLILLLFGISPPSSGILLIKTPLEEDTSPAGASFPDGPLHSPPTPPPLFS